ncbi:MAG: isoprenylcysteine carboxylmethyltransferase family protein [Oligoflexia bacterium]|nr:isoprenylcysteine carboxylmethyltransferase family protein [Oligoflexia bacterium]
MSSLQNLQNLQKKVPLLISVIFSLSIVAATVYRLYNSDRFQTPVVGVFLIFLYLVWLLIESRVAITELKKDSTNIDKGTLEMYAFGRFATVMASLIVAPSITLNLVEHLICLALFVCGIIFRLYAINILGKFYSHRVRITNDHKIISHGPYSFIRHPAYIGMIVGHLGFVLFFFNWVALSIYLCFFIPTIIHRILVEEKILFMLPGYKEYATKRKRIIPFVW